MPTKDGGKPPSRKRTGGAGKGAESSGQARGTRKRTPSSQEQAAPTPAPTPTPAPAPEKVPAPRRRAPRAPTAPPRAAGEPAVPLEPIARELHAQPQASAAPSALPLAVEPAVAEPLSEQPIVAAEQPSAPPATLEEPPPSEEAEEAETEPEAEEAELEYEPEEEPGAATAEELPAGDSSPRRRDRRGAGTNALGVFIERQFAYPTSPCHSYSDLERHSGISREALSRYVTARADRRRSPTIDTLVAIADALHVGLEAVARAAGASVRGVIPPPEDVQHAREEALGALVATLTDEQFNAVVELLRQMRPPSA